MHIPDIPESFDQYWFKVQAYEKNYDGDTITLTVDLGCDVSLKMRIRLYDLDTPEVNRTEQREAGLVAQRAAQEWLEHSLLADETWVYSIKKEGFGRYLGHVYAIGQKDTLSEYMVRSGFGVAWEGHRHVWTPEELSAIVAKKDTLDER